MKFLQFATIRGKLTVASIVLLAGFIIIGYTYTYSLNVKEQLITQNNRLNQFQLLAKEANIMLINAQKIEAAYKETSSISLVRKHAKLMNRLRETISQMKRLSPGPTEDKMLKNLQQSQSKYETAFKRTVVAIVEVGHNKPNGLIARLEKRAAAIEKPVNATGNSRLINTLLKIRQQEKVFLLSPLTTNPQVQNKLLEQFQGYVKQVGIPLSTKRSILYNLKRYKNILTEIKFALEDVYADTYVLNKKSEVIESNIKTMLTRAKTVVSENRAVSDQKAAFTNIITLGVLVTISLFISIMFINLTRRISGQLHHLDRTIKRISAGDYDARTYMESEDELGILGRSFDSMLDDRMTQMALAERENAQLNDSIVDLLETVSTMSNKDLTVSVPVAENVTGAVGDAINMLAFETAGVLSKIRQVASQVDQAAATIRSHSTSVSGAAETERKVLQHTVMKLQQTAESMNQIAQDAQECNRLGKDASDSTDLALDKVNNAMLGMEEIRETISETEKRIKRLGERSQEITQIVEIINSISERTHILALNASMQSAAAGDAGRGFAVVAEEVQRLAESVKGETSQISELVNSIQSETSSTMVAMNKAISQVVRGSDLAEEASRQMSDTKETTARLVLAVGEIAKESVEQARINNDIGHSAEMIQKSTMNTCAKLSEQDIQTKNLVVFAEEMMKKVNEFKLPHN